MAAKEYVIPASPLEKEVHLFVSYHNSDESKVRDLVKLLEQQGLTCCYYDRDFTAGCTIFDNIRGKILKSMQMLVILSEEFNKSAYGMHELTQALHLQINEGYSIIPIMVEPCSVPDCLKYIRYIDAKDIDVTEMPSLIIDAVVKNKIDADFKQATGNLISVGLTKVKRCLLYLCLSTYKLEFDEHVRQKISDNSFQFTDGELKEIEDIVSNAELLWKKLVTELSRVNKEARQKGRIVLFDYTRGELILMRYDFRICQAYFIKRCEQQKPLLVNKAHRESIMEYTNRLFDEFVQSERCQNLISPSVTKRHTILNGGKCLCLLVEDEIGKAKPFT